jgi:hypothetical protein
MNFGLTRQNLSAVNVVNSAGLIVLIGNSFHAMAATNMTSSGGSSSGNSNASAAGTKAMMTKASGEAQSTVTSTSLVGANATKGPMNTTVTSRGGTSVSTNAAENAHRERCDDCGVECVLLR